MFEPLISSRIRRTLLEYLLAHPGERFYLRGLARQLNLTISPLRRELKRLERLGVLTAVEEANAKFYAVNQTSAYFTQLQSAAGSPTVVGSGLRAQGSERLVAVAQSPQPSAQSVERRVRFWPAFAGAAGGAVVVVGVMTYLVLTNARLLSVAKQALAGARTQVTVVTAAPRVSGEMRGTRWRLLPGSFGGFSAGDSQESY